MEPKKPGSLNSDEIEAVDEEFARHFAQVSHEAYKAALEAGIPVAVASEGVLWRVVKQDGRITRTKIKSLPSPVPVNKDVPFTIR